jgi:hypothetical protein
MAERDGSMRYVVGGGCSPSGTRRVSLSLTFRLWVLSPLLLHRYSPAAAEPANACALGSVRAKR